MLKPDQSGPELGVHLVLERMQLIYSRDRIAAADGSQGRTESSQQRLLVGIIARVRNQAFDGFGNRYHIHGYCLAVRSQSVTDRQCDVVGSHRQSHHGHNAIGKVVCRTGEPRILQRITIRVIRTRAI